MINAEFPYWIALAHIGGWRIEKINRLIVNILHESQSTFEDFFNLAPGVWLARYGLEASDIEKLIKTKGELANYAFLAEDLIEQGFDIITLNSADYPLTLKENLKLKHSPTILYTKGNKELLHQCSVAIVGSRSASSKALVFTESRARIAVEENKVVVSGFAPGVDQHALESALKFKGRSIVVLPQGVMTFSSGFKKYYQQVWEGDVLILSSFHPKARWTPQLAMSRNPIIYGLANEIYVAECQEKSGTWAGATDGLRKGRVIYVRRADPTEQNANALLLEKGAIAIDSDKRARLSDIPLVSDIGSVVYNDEASPMGKIMQILTESRELTAKELIAKAQLKISTQRINNLLKEHPDIELVHGKVNKFRLKNQPFQQPTLL